ncbi:MAG: ABC transporter permease [bacterium]|nr:ABC transporter permease [bacterium]MCY3953633.1 ABC transporter permease [bacterium]
MRASRVAAETATAGAWPSWGRLVWTSMRSQNRTFWRNPVASFFTLGLPLIMLVLFGSLFTWDVDVGFGTVPAAQFYTPALAAFTAANAALANVGITLAFQRQFGLLKRVRGTPLPPSAFLGGTVASSVWIALLGTLIMMLVGVLFFDVGAAAAKIPAAVVAFVVGTAAFAGLGLALAALAPSGNGAPAIANAVILPMAFVSNIFVPAEDPPAWLRILGDVLPLKHFGNSFSAAFHPAVPAPAWRGVDLAVLAAWGVAGALAAWRFFDWMPRMPRARRSAAAE